LILAVDFAGSHSGPPGEIVKPSEGLKGQFLVIVVVRDFGGNGVMLAEGSKGVVIPLLEPVPVRELCDHAGGTLDSVGGDIKGLVIGRVFIGWSVEWVMETTGQTGVVLLRPGGGEAGYADGERATGETEPRWPGRRLEGLLLAVSIVLGLRNRVGGSEGISVDGLTFEIGIVRGARSVGDPGSRESEPRDIRDV
jgi:hypothetical protein